MIEKANLKTHCTEKETEIKHLKQKVYFKRMIVGNLPNLKTEIDIWTQEVFSTPSSRDCRKPLTYYSHSVKNTKQKY